MTASFAIDGTFPSHGPITCRCCFVGTEADSQMRGKWKVVNDPGAWGSGDPEIVLLGFSKGFTQADAYRTRPFDDVPFRDMRARLTAALQAVHILEQNETVDEKMRASERRIAFGSLVRCSLSRLNDKSGRMECTGQVMPKAFSEEVAPVVRRCAETYLRGLPSRTKLVLMLGTTDEYIRCCKQLIKSLYGDQFRDVNEVGYRTDQVHWVHISHPSRSNGHHSDWVSGTPDTKTGNKRLLAEKVIQSSGVGLCSS